MPSGTLGSIPQGDRSSGSPSTFQNLLRTLAYSFGLPLIVPPHLLHVEPGEGFLFDVLLQLGDAVAKLCGLHFGLCGSCALVLPEKSRAASRNEFQVPRCAPPPLFEAGLYSLEALEEDDEAMLQTAKISSIVLANLISSQWLRAPMRCGGWFTTTTWFSYASGATWTGTLSSRLCPGLLHAIATTTPPRWGCVKMWPSGRRIPWGISPAPSSPISLPLLRICSFRCSSRRLRFRSPGTGDLSFLFSRSPLSRRTWQPKRGGGCLRRLPQGLFQFQPRANSSRRVVQLLSPLIRPWALASMAMPALWQGSTASTHPCAPKCDDTRKLGL